MCISADGKTISIHAPTRGATLSCDLSTGSIPISIHAPTRGATMLAGVYSAEYVFQSTLPRGERHPAFHQINNCLSYFNPRSHEGSDLTAFPKFPSVTTFQSTLPRGERLNGLKTAVTTAIFQSTLPRGERPNANWNGRPRNYISIHAPTRGATFCKIKMRLIIHNFNPRSHEGSDAIRVF